MKISMVCSASRSDEMIVTGEDLQRAIKFLTQAEIKMPYTFGSMGESPMASTLNNLMLDIGQAGRISQQELLKRHYYDIGNQRVFEDMLIILEKQGYCRRINVQGTGTVIEHIKLTRS